MNSRVTRVGTFKVCVPTHVALRMFIMQVLASQLHFLANKNAQLAIPPLFWSVNCIKIGGHVALLSDPTVCTLYCDIGNSLQAYTLAFQIQCILLDRYQNVNPLPFKFNFINLDYLGLYDFHV